MSEAPSVSKGSVRDLQHKIELALAATQDIEAVHALDSLVEQLEAAQDRIEELEGWAGRRPGEVAARRLEIWQGWAGTYPASKPDA